MSSRLRITLLAGAGFLLLQLGWMLCIAPNYGIDEFDHSYRASSVADGHWGPGTDPIPVKQGRGDLIPVRADVVAAAHAACAARPYTGIYNCSPLKTLKGGEVLIAGGAARYNPSYYAVVGTIAKPFTGTANLYAMRIATALFGAVLFMLAVWLTVAGARTVWPLVTVLLSALPTTVYSASLTSPNGVEMLAGLAAWVALGALVAPRGSQHRRTAYGVLAVSGAVLANTHTLGPLWLGLIGVTLAIVHGLRGTVRAVLPRSRFELVAAAGLVLAVGFEVGWVKLSGVNDPSLALSTFRGSPWPYIVRGVFLWPLQAIGAFPMRNDSAPLIVYALVGIPLAGFCAVAIRRAGVRSRAVLGMAFIAVASFVIPAYLTARTFEQLGSAWQGRYATPFTVGLLVLIGGVLDAGIRTGARPRTVGGVALGLLLVGQLISQWTVMTKQRANFSLVAGTGWVPPSEALLVTLILLAGYCWFHAVTKTETETAPVVDPQVVVTESVLA